MSSMVSYSCRPQSGHFTCYLNRTYHVLLTHHRHHRDLLTIHAAECSIEPRARHGHVEEREVMACGRRRCW